jgi:isoaspartyl peptidase/L-asparaginase-like protein (Ntn-hydrolase superfamily)
MTLLLALALAQPAPPPAVLIVHGGLGVLTADEMRAEGLARDRFEAGLVASLRAGHAVWAAGKPGLDVVEAAVRVLEDDPLFNAGRGAALTADGRAELDAAIMEGRMTGAADGKLDPRKRAGAVTGVTRVKNPISAARAVLEMPGNRHALLAGDGVERFVLGEPTRSRFRIEEVPNTYFWTDRRLKQVRPKDKHGTVGAVALDKSGSLAAGTSTGGTAGKLPGRVGDTPLVGAGTYADDRACGVSGTGTGELFIRHAVAADVVARMLYGKQPVEAAAKAAIDQLPDEEYGSGGLIALDRQGRAAFPMSARSVGMYRGYVTAAGEVFTAVYAGDRWNPERK